MDVVTPYGNVRDVGMGSGLETFSMRVNVGNRVVSFDQSSLEQYMWA